MIHKKIYANNEQIIQGSLESRNLKENDPIILWYLTFQFEIVHVITNNKTSTLWH